MDPRSAWYPAELDSGASDIWTNVWMVSQMNQAAAPSTAPLHHAHTQPNMTRTITPPSVTTPRSATSPDESHIDSTTTSRRSASDDSNATTRSIQEGFRLKVNNKASTFGFNFPPHSDYLSEALSTPWISTVSPQQKSRSVTSIPSPTSSSSSTCSDSSIDISSCSEEVASIGLGFQQASVETTALQSLHREILQFSEYIAPTLEELYMREDIIHRIRAIVEATLPNATVEVYGSYRTGLFLPTSDIDLAVIGQWQHAPPMDQLKDALLLAGIAQSDTTRMFDRATVPIIKILQPGTELKVDISFNTVNGVRSAELIGKYLLEFPCLRPLVMILKQFLIQRDFNEVWTGGIGSYSLILMVVNFLQQHASVDARHPDANLAVLLIEFFQLYGKQFNYMKTGIRIRQLGGEYQPKEEMLKHFSANLQSHRSSILCIEDPLNLQNDIGKGSWAMLRIKQAFESAYYMLHHAVLPQNEFILRSTQSILGRIIRVTKEVTDYRVWVKQRFEREVRETHFGWPHCAAAFPLHNLVMEYHCPMVAHPFVDRRASQPNIHTEEVTLTLSQRQQMALNAIPNQEHIRPNSFSHRTGSQAMPISNGKQSMSNSNSKLPHSHSSASHAFDMHRRKSSNSVCSTESGESNSSSQNGGYRKLKSDQPHKHTSSNHSNYQQSQAAPRTLRLNNNNGFYNGSVWGQKSHSSNKPVKFYIDETNSDEPEAKRMLHSRQSAASPAHEQQISLDEMYKENQKPLKVTSSQKCST